MRSSSSFAEEHVTDEGVHGIGRARIHWNVVQYNDKRASLPVFHSDDTYMNSSVDITPWDLPLNHVLGELETKWLPPSHFERSPSYLKNNAAKARLRRCNCQGGVAKRPNLLIAAVTFIVSRRFVLDRNTTTIRYKYAPVES